MYLPLTNCQFSKSLCIFCCDMFGKMLVLILLHNIFPPLFGCLLSTHKTRLEFGILIIVAFFITRHYLSLIYARNIINIFINHIWKLLNNLPLTSVNCNTLRIFARCPWWCYPRRTVYHATWLFRLGSLHAWIYT